MSEMREANEDTMPERGADESAAYPLAWEGTLTLEAAAEGKTPCAALGGGPSGKALGTPSAFTALAAVPGSGECHEADAALAGFRGSGKLCSFCLVSHLLGSVAPESIVFTALA